MSWRWLGRSLVAATALASLTPLPATALTGQGRNSRTQAGSGPPVDTSFTVDRGATVDVQIPKGQIVVTSWQRPDIRVQATAPSSALIVEKSASRVAIRLRADGRTNAEVRVEVTVPQHMALLLGITDGGVSARDVNADVEVRGSHTDVEITDVRGRTVVETITGDVRASRLVGDTRINVIDGDVVLSEVEGAVSVQTVSGRALMSGVHSGTVHAQTVSGDLRYEGSMERGGRYDFSSHSGDIRLVLAAGAGAQFSAQSTIGQIYSEFPVTMSTGVVGGSGRVMNFDIGDGSARVTLETFSGGITIQRGPGRGPEVHDK